MTTNGDGAIHVEIDPDQPLPERYLGSDEDGPHYGPTTLYDAIVETAASKLVARCEKQMTNDVANRIGEAAEALIDKKLPGLIDEAMTGEITITDQWGQPRSSGTLHDLIVKYAQDQLKTSGRGSFNETLLDKAVKEHVGYTLSRDLAGAVTEAKKKLLKELTEQTSETLSKAIFDGVVRSR